MAEDYYNPDYDGEINSNGMGLRHVDTWGRIGDNFEIDSPLAGIAGLGLRFKSEEQQKQLQKLEQELTKRHLGSLAASSGARNLYSFPRVGKSSLGSFFDQHQDENENDDEGYGTDFYGLDRHLPLSVYPVEISEEDFAEPEELTNVNTNVVSTSADVDASGNSSVEPTKRTEYVDESTLLKGKRFLGSMARGGWFPRQFRGFIEPSLDKRHIGAFARFRSPPSPSLLELIEKRHIGAIARLRVLNDTTYFKRNIGSIARIQSSNDPSVGKKNIGSIARLQSYKDPNTDKRNIASIARLQSYNDADVYKRNMASIARMQSYNDPDAADKRNIASIARLQSYNDANADKRNIGSIARLQSYNDANTDKRNIGSIARLQSFNDPSVGKKNIGSIARMQSYNDPNADKRNIASIARMQSYNDADIDKRNIASIARLQGYNDPMFGKRNIGSIARLQSYNDPTFDKRNIASVARLRSFMEPNFEKRNLASIARLQSYNNDPTTYDSEKRNVGAFAKLRSFNQPADEYDKRNVAAFAKLRGVNNEPQLYKRHIGAVARLGWLPYIKPNRMEEASEGGFKRNVQSLRKSGFGTPGGNKIYF